MTIHEINDNELEVKQSDIMLVFLAAGFAILGIGMLFTPIFDMSKWWLALVGLAIIGVSVAVAFLVPKRRYAVLRKASTSDVTETRILTKKVIASTSFNTADIVGVGLDTNTSYERDRDSNGSTTMQEVRRSRLYITLQNGSQILLGTASKSGANMTMGGRFSLSSRSLVNGAPLSNEANRLASFLGVPLNGNTAGQKIDGLVGKAVDTVANGLFGNNDQPPAEQPQLTQTPQVATQQPIAPPVQPVQQAPPQAPLTEQQTPPTSPPTV